VEVELKMRTTSRNLRQVGLWEFALAKLYNCTEAI
jgi:hypothetical protein